MRTRLLDRIRRLPPVLQIARGRAKTRTLLSDRSGSAAVEFGFVGPMVILTILAIMSLGYLIIMGQMLDYATQRSARLVRIGTVQKSNLSQAKFRTDTVCSFLPVLFRCNDVIVNLQTITTTGSNHPNEYYNYVKSDQSGLIMPDMNNSTATYCPGLQKNYEYLQIMYPVSLFQIFVYNVLGTTVYNGQNVHAIMSTATFLNEPFGSAGTSC